MTQGQEQGKPDEQGNGGGEPANLEREQTPEQPDNAGTDDAAKLRKEAAGYRRKLRETEGERDTLRGALDGLQRAQVERLVADPTSGAALASGSDLWTAGVQLEELRAEDGSIDPEKVKEARDRVLGEKPHWRQESPSFDGGARESEAKGAPSFGDAMKQAAGR